MNSKNGFEEKIQGWEYITSMIDVIRNPSLILDGDKNIFFANSSFGKTFQVDLSNYSGKNIFEVSNTQFKIAQLVKLVNEIIPQNGFFNDLELHHDFPFIGEKIFLVSAKKINQVIFLTMEDVTITFTVAKTLADIAKIQVDKISRLEQDIQDLKTKKV